MAKELKLEIKVDDKGSAVVRKFAYNFEKDLKKSDDAAFRFQGTLKKSKLAMAGFATVLTGALAGAMGAFVKVTKVGMAFEKAMAEVAAATGATKEELNLLTSAAKEMGSKTEKSATDAAAALGTLSKAGLSAKEAVTVLPTVLNLATAASVSLDDAADSLVSTIKSFGLEVSSSSKVADIFAATITASNQNLSDLAQAMKKVGPAAKATGTSLKETAAMLKVLADSGVKAAEAGTGLKAALLKANSAGLKLGMEGGKSLKEVLKKMKEEGMGAKEAMELFGLETVTTALILMNNIDSIEDFEKALENADGAALKMATTMRDTTAGAFATLWSAIEGITIGVFEIFASDLKEILLDIAKWLSDNADTWIWWMKAVYETLKHPIETLKTLWATVTDKAKDVWGSFKDWVKDTFIPAIVDKFIAFKETAKAVWVKITDKAKDVWGSFKDWVKETFLPAIIDKFIAFKERAKEIWALVTDKVKAIWGAFREWVGEGFLGVLINKFVSFKESAKEIWAKITEKAKAIWGAFTTWVGESFLGVIVEKFLALKDKVKEVWAKITDKAKAILGSFKDWVKDNFLDKIKEKFRDFRDSLSGVWHRIVDGARETLAAFVSWIGDHFVNPVREKIESVTKVVSGIGTGVELVQSGFSALGEFVSGIFKKKVVDDSLVPVKSAQEAVTDAVGSSEGAVESLESAFGESTTAINSSLGTSESAVVALEQTVESKSSIMRSAFAGLGEAIAKEWEDTRTNIESAMASILKDSILGKIKSAKEAFKSFGKAVLDEMTDLITKVAAKKIVMYFSNMWKPGAQKGQGFIEKLLGIDIPFLEFASGGNVPGTGSGDTVPILATPGEFVVNKKAAQNPGVKSMLQAVNSGASPMGFAEGGEIPGGMPTAVSSSFAEAMESIPDNWGALGDDPQKMGMGGFIKKMGSSISKAWEGFLGGLKKAWSKLSKWVKSTVDEAMKWVKEAASWLYEHGLDMVMKVMGKISDFFGQTSFGRVLALLGNVALAVATGGASLPYQLAGAAAGGYAAYEQGGDLSDMLWGANAQAFMTGIAGTVGKVVGEAFKSGDFFGGLQEAGSALFKGGSDFSVQSLLQAIKTAPQEAIGKMIESGKGLWDNAKNWAWSDFVDQAMSRVNELVTMTKDIWNTLQDEGFVNALKIVAKKFWDFDIKQVYEAVTSALKNFASSGAVLGPVAAAGGLFASYKSNSWNSGSGVPSPALTSSTIEGPSIQNVPVKKAVLKQFQDKVSSDDISLYSSGAFESLLSQAKDFDNMIASPSARALEGLNVNASNVGPIYDELLSSEKKARKSSFSRKDIKALSGMRGKKSGAKKRFRDRVVSGARNDMERARAGGLFSSPTIMGEAGAEWAVPTYEPERSSFLKDVGVDEALKGSGGTNINVQSLITINGSLIADENQFDEFVKKINDKLYQLQRWGY